MTRKMIGGQLVAGVSLLGLVAAMERFTDWDIPLIIHAPKFVRPERHDSPISQIDAVPTLLSLLRFRYVGDFYGMNALDPRYVSRYFLSNYQKLAYAKGRGCVIMRPVRGVHFYRDGHQIGAAEAANAGDCVAAPDAALQETLEEGISYYQHAARWREFLKEEPAR